MRRLLSFSMLLILFGCKGDDTPGISNPTYYWADGEKISLTVMKNKYYLLFPAEDASAVIGAVNRSGGDMAVSDIFEYNPKSINYKGDIPVVFADCSFAVVTSGAALSLDKVPELIYITPFYKIADGSELGITNVLSVLLKNARDFAKLEELAERYNLVLLGESLLRPSLYFLSCTKDSRGNALEMANRICETNLFQMSSPEFLVVSQHN